MPYTADIPLFTQNISTTQPLIRENFNALEPFGNGYAILTNQLVSPPVAGTDLGVYNFNSAFTAAPALFFKDAAGIKSEFTSTQTGAFMLATQSWTQLPSGVIIKWGNISTTVLGTNTVTFNPAYPAFTSGYQVVITAQRGGAATDPNQALYASVTGLTAFNVYCYLRTGTGTITNTPFSWIAIGV